jgi:hypothetical protein
VAAHQAGNKPRFLAPLPSFKQRLCYLLLKKHRTRKQCEQLVPRSLRAVCQLRRAGLAQLAYGFRNFENYRLRVKVLCA